MFPPDHSPAGPSPMFQRDPAVGSLIENAVRKLEATNGQVDGDPPRAPDDQAEAREKMYMVAQVLCDEGNFLQAAPLAMSLAINSPYDPRFYFITGRAFQRLGVFNVAQTFYEHAMREGESALPMYRLAECLAGQGKTKEAVEHFDRSFALGREDPQYRSLQDHATNAIERIRKQSQK